MPGPSRMSGHDVKVRKVSRQGIKVRDRSPINQADAGPPGDPAPTPVLPV